MGQLRERLAVLRLGLSFALGCMAAWAAFRLPVPGAGAFIVLTWLAGLAASAAAPGWAGMPALLAGATVTAVAISLPDSTPTLLVVVVAIIAAIAGHGALVATIARRMRRLGVRRSSRDAGVLAGSAATVIVLAGFIWLNLGGR